MKTSESANDYLIIYIICTYVEGEDKLFIFNIHAVFMKGRITMWKDVETETTSTAFCVPTDKRCGLTQVLKVCKERKKFIIMIQYKYI